MKLYKWINTNNLISYALSRNINAIQYLQNNPRFINWYGLCENRNPAVLPILYKNKEHIKWNKLSSNPLAMDLIITNMDKIDWKELSSNTHFMAMELLMKNMDKIDWNKLSLNSNDWAIDLLMNNHLKHIEDKINTIYKVLWLVLTLSIGAVADLIVRLLAN
jgi:hypothetical protein